MITAPNKMLTPDFYTCFIDKDAGSSVSSQWVIYRKLEGIGWSVLWWASDGYSHLRRVFVYKQNSEPEEGCPKDCRVFNRACIIIASVIQNSSNITLVLNFSFLFTKHDV